MRLIKWASHSSHPPFIGNTHSDICGNVILEPPRSHAFSLKGQAGLNQDLLHISHKQQFGNKNKQNKIFHCNYLIVNNQSKNTHSIILEENVIFISGITVMIFLYYSHNVFTSKGIALEIRTLQHIPPSLFVLSDTDNIILIQIKICQLGKISLNEELLCNFSPCKVYTVKGLALKIYIYSFSYIKFYTWEKKI